MRTPTFSFLFILATVASAAVVRQEARAERRIDAQLAPMPFPLTSATVVKGVATDAMDLRKRADSSSAAANTAASTTTASSTTSQSSSSQSSQSGSQSTSASSSGSSSSASTSASSTSTSSASKTSSASSTSSSTSSSASASATSDSSSSQSSGLGVGAIVGIVIGALFFIFVLSIFFSVWRKHQHVARKRPRGSVYVPSMNNKEVNSATFQPLLNPSAHDPEQHAGTMDATPRGSTEVTLGPPESVPLQQTRHDTELPPASDPSWIYRSSYPSPYESTSLPSPPPRTSRPPSSLLESPPLVGFSPLPPARDFPSASISSLLEHRRGAASSSSAAHSSTEYTGLSTTEFGGYSSENRSPLAHTQP